MKIKFFQLILIGLTLPTMLSAQTELSLQEAIDFALQNSAEIKERFRTASIITATRVVFNIGGNNYRLICIVRFDKQIIFIRFIGTHDEYDKINAAEI